MFIKNRFPSVFLGIQLQEKGNEERGTLKGQVNSNHSLMRMPKDFGVIHTAQLLKFKMILREKSIDN